MAISKFQLLNDVRTQKASPQKIYVNRLVFYGIKEIAFLGRQNRDLEIKQMNL